MVADNTKSARIQEDQALVEEAKGGDQKAYGTLMERYKVPIHFMILKMVNNKDDADDLTIEAFGKAFSNLEKYNPNFAFSTWLFKIAVNNAIDFIRKKRLNTLSMDKPIDGENGADFSLNIASNQLDPEEEFIKSQRKKLTNEVVDKLMPKYRSLIKLRYFDEYSYDEISQELSLPLGTVKAQLFRAKELLYNILKNDKSKY